MANSLTLPDCSYTERAILGAAMLGGFAAASQHLTADDFSLDSYRRIWRAMSKLSVSDAEIDLISVTQHLATIGERTL